MVPQTSEPNLRGALSTLPLSLFLTPKISPDRAAAFRELASSRPRYARIVDVEEGAISVLPDFEHEEISALERRRCRIIGLPFAERLLHDPSSVEKINALPLYDFILPPESSVCHSALPPPVKLRCSVLAKWMGARISDEMNFAKGLLVTVRVSLHPRSKYQEALARNVPIVRPSFLEAAWDSKERVSVEQYALPALSGLAVCFDPRHADIIDQYRWKLAEHGAVMEPLNQAEVVIVKDVFSPLYEDAQKIGILCAPPLWLDRCFQLRRCVPIRGELEVPKIQSIGSTAPGQSLGSFGDAAAFQHVCNGALLGSVLCLLYLPSADDRNYAKQLAWKCGAFTTLDPHDRAITHVLFKAVSKMSVNVSVPVDEDRISFLDISWLESCVRERRRAPEEKHSQQLVNYNPTCDHVHAAILGRNINSTTAPNHSHIPGKASLEARPSDTVSASRVPLADIAPARVHQPPTIGKPMISMPTSEKGVFAGARLGVFIGQSAQEQQREQGLVDKLCAHGATVIRGSPEAIAEAQPAWCVCCDTLEPSLANFQSSLKLATGWWVNACIADGIQHSRASFPHFKPCQGTLPIPEMNGCAIRLAAVGSAQDPAQTFRKRELLGEAVQLMGAKVVDQKATWREITHMVCVVPALVDPKQYEGALKRDKHMVSIKWLFDSFDKGSRQREEVYVVKSPQSVTASPEGQMGTPIAKASNFTVLASYHVFISPCSLASNGKLPCQAEQLGAEVHTWRSAEELQAALAAYGITPCGSSGDNSSSRLAADKDSSTATNVSNVIVLVEKEDVSTTLIAYVNMLAASQRIIFVSPAWLAETFSQRRSLPLEAFAALPVPDAEGQAAKRQRTGEARYAWQSAASKSLTQLSEETRAMALHSKQTHKLSEGLRLADLHREGATPSSTASGR